VLEADRGTAAIALVQQHPEIECIVLDHDFKLTEPHVTGLDVIRQLEDIAPHIPVIMMSGVTEGRLRVAVDAIKKHAIDFLEVPFPTKVLLDKVDEVIGRKSTTSAHAQDEFRLHGFISVSAVMAEVCEQALDAAANEWNVLIVGETGVGKDTLARAMHELGPRKSHSFVEFNCGIVSRELFNSELFGHRRGAFTGAADEKPGLLEAADRGTIFLNEIADMPLDTQVGLNQAIESKKFRRLGDTQEKTFDARIIAATKYSIHEAMRKKLLRDDVRYRFKDTIEIPPLRKRPEDIPAIVRNYLRHEYARDSRAPVDIDDAAMALLERQPWAGNVRQLLGVVGLAAVHGKSSTITVAAVEKELRKEYGIPDRRAIAGNLDQTIENIRREYIIDALTASHGNISEGARHLGYATKEGLKHWLEKLGIDPKVYHR
jgi:DNA-binding NtrC family response regulator